jgi:DNA-binding transcriptional regulator YhcF (GntR family)
MSLQFTNRNSKVQQLVDYIQKSIAARELKFGDKLPSINKLSQDFHISRDTVFKAFSDLKKRGIIESVHGKNYYVSSVNRNILLLLDEYTPFKETLYNTLRNNLPTYYHIDLWFHQYNEQLFNQIIHNSAGLYNQYLVMNYHNEQLSDSLSKIDKKKLLLLDFGKFDKKGYSYVCQDFDEALYQALESIQERLRGYDKLFFVFNKSHKHPTSSKQFFSQFCIDHDFAFEIIEEVNEKTTITRGSFYLVIKQEDIVSIIRQGRKEKLQMQSDYGLLAYNENPFYEVIDGGISSIGIDWRRMGELTATFVTSGKPVHTYMPTLITERNSY